MLLSLDPKYEVLRVVKNTGQLGCWTLQSHLGHWHAMPPDMLEYISIIFVQAGCAGKWASQVA